MTTKPAAAARAFADNVAAYALAGWPCILPVPPDKKWPPPVGFTGEHGRDTDPMQLVIWAGSHPGHAIALRMPPNIIGIDIDHYDKTVSTPEGAKTVQKRGADTLAEYVTRWGPLPPTWSSTARGSDKGPGPSRILFYRVPEGRYATRLGDAIEIIQRHHRYAVVPPSPHPDTGGTYRWYDPFGQPSPRPDLAPHPAYLPQLPPRWVQGLTEAATAAAPAAADEASGYTLLDALLADERTPCVEVTNAALSTRAQLSGAGTGSRHDTATARVHHLVQLGAAGHPGVGPVLAEARALWEQLTAGEDRDNELERMLLGSARKAVTAIGTTQPVNRDPCLLSGFGAYNPQRPADEHRDPVTAQALASSLSLHEAIGAHAFDPDTDHDQPLADAILRRLVPGLRYATDAGTWLIRRSHCWDLAKDLAPSAVAIIAPLTPTGDPKAEKGSPQRRRAERHRRLMSAAGASLVAAKVKALATAGNHPCAIRLADLDTDPDVLWAGGTPWDLRASLERPVPAGVDPATPHLHAVRFAPDPDRPTPLWEAFLAAVWPDPGVRAWALRVLSIAVTGYPNAALPILLGPTRRGKSQLVALLMSVLGSYAHAADPRLLTGTETAHACIVYELKGRRLSFIDEGPRRGFGAQERLKQLTGGAALTGNPMRKNPITFTPTHTLVLTANPEAEICLTDPAIRARVRLIPCDGDEAAVRAVREAIGPLSMPTWQAEAPGVLAQMMREAARWLADPTSAETAASPAAIRGMAEEIAEEQDPVRVWLDTATVADETGTGSTELYQAFITWCRSMDIQRPPSITRWGRDLTTAGYPVKRGPQGVRHRPLRLRLPGIGAWVMPLAPPQPNGQPAAVA